MSGMRDKIAQTTKTAQTVKTAQTERAAHAAQSTKSSPFKRPSGRATFPRRMTLDLDQARFDWLRRQAYESRVSAAALLRAAIDLLQADEKFLRTAVSEAAKDNPPPA